MAERFSRMKNQLTAGQTPAAADCPRGLNLNQHTAMKILAFDPGKFKTIHPAGGPTRVNVGKPHKVKLWSYESSIANAQS